MSNRRNMPQSLPLIPSRSPNFFSPWRKMAKLDTCLAIVTKLFIGSSFYLLSRMIMKACSHSMDESDGSLSGSHTQGKGCDVGESSFGKGVFLMTIGWGSMIPALLFFFFYRMKHVPQESYGWRAVSLVAVPSTADMTSTVLSTYGLPWTSLSLAFIFKGGRVVFSAFLTVLLLRRRLYGYHWLAVAMCMVGLTIAASSQLLSAPSSMLGILLVLGSELFKAFRVILEERLMKTHSFDPCFLVGIEGLFGTVIFTTTLIVVWLGIKGDDHGSFENLQDTIYRISHSDYLIALFCIFPPITCVVSIASAVVTQKFSAVINSFISVVRVGILWLCELAIYYSFTSSPIGKQLGEPWNKYSWLKLVGFLVVLVSTLIYDEDLKLRCWFKYDHLTPEKDVVHT
jgi:drug/metabolite transporter (DMT)-like permease